MANMQQGGIGANQYKKKAKGPKDPAAISIKQRAAIAAEMANLSEGRPKKRTASKDAVSGVSERDAGKLLAAMEKEKGGGTGANQYKKAAGTKKEPAAKPTKTLKEMGVSKKQSAKWQALAIKSPTRLRRETGWGEGPSLAAY